MVYSIDDSWQSNHLQWNHLRWKLQNPTVSFSHPFLQLQTIESQHPKTNKILRACCLHTKDWVNVFGLTPDKKLIVVLQFRFGSKAVSLETPGGIIDDGETHQQAAIREFQEETGYSSSEIYYIGALTPNAATHTNKTHFYFFKDCFILNNLQKKQDEFECIEVALVSLAHFQALIRNGQVDHALIIAGFFLSLSHFSL